MRIIKNCYDIDKAYGLFLWEKNQKTKALPTGNVQVHEYMHSPGSPPKCTDGKLWCGHTCACKRPIGDCHS